MNICTRCGGFTVPDPTWDGRIVTQGWRCIICGEFVDEVVLRNRIFPRFRRREPRTPPRKMLRTKSLAPVIHWSLRSCRRKKTLP